MKRKYGIFFVDCVFKSKKEPPGLPRQVGNELYCVMAHRQWHTTATTEVRLVCISMRGFEGKYLKETAKKFTRYGKTFRVPA